MLFRSEAIAAYEKALAIDPEYAEAYYNMGQAHLRAQRFAEARTHFVEALKRKPDDVYANYYMGLLHARDGDFARAADVLERAVEGDGDFLDARQKLAVSYLKTGRVEDSKRQLQILKEKQEELGDHAQHDH